MREEYMYIVYESGKFYVSTEAENAVVELCAPRYLSEGTEKILMPAGEGPGYADEENRAELEIRQVSDTLFYVKRVWQNISYSVKKIQTIFRVKTCFVPERYLIPCVNVNGNVFGNGGVPKGM